ncbi:MAG TPA: hypothetical protein VIJ22_00720 [Polyangiaceae bacterium]
MKKDLASVTIITLNAVDYTPASLMALFQSFIDLADATVTARASWLLAVQKEAALLTRIMGVLSALKAYVTLKFGPGAVDTQADFGFSPRKVVVMTAAEKTASAAKAKATRAARHTMGSDQKKAVTGASVAEPISPATTTTNPAPAVTPQAPATTKS